jgi:hypothetical protein
MNEKKIHELIGRIKDKDREKVYTGRFAGTYYYVLNTTIENKEVNKLFAFKDKIELESIWKDIEESNYIDKRYLFYCERRKGGFALKNWKELNHGSN